MEGKYFIVALKGGWAVKAEGKQMPVATYPHKEEAIKRGTAEAMMHESELIIEHEDGRSEIKSFANKPTV